MTSGLNWLLNYIDLTSFGMAADIFFIIRQALLELVISVNLESSELNVTMILPFCNKS